ncbi:putative fungal-specific transcription factor domain-containing protein [Achaetomium macrosporum]|uniref:Fungal-specific transcription factor domain-containing protein n=1 Tax=Achaetomium macrosporum TaxID=79813 RepID=A0AAN7HAR3_9PEZI|nr:putative fungal-specific transcription factor domain-containing protein [Achaetomium macrosporum]
MSNAQAAASDLAAYHGDLLGLQALLGLVMLHLGRLHESLTAAKTLMASGFKLAHKLGLFQSKVNALFDSETALHRAHIFWILYALDRDLSLRTFDPPLIQDADHDIAKSTSTFASGLIRFVASTGDDIFFNVISAWINLAHIQNEIHEKLYAPAARQLLALQFTCLACILQMHRVGSHDAEWIARLVDYSQRAERNMHLLLNPPIDCNALTVMEHHRNDVNAEADEKLIAEAVAFLARVAAETPDWETPCKLHAACDVLRRRARIARHKFTFGRPVVPEPASVAWLEAAARHSAGLSAIALVQAITTAEVKPLAARLW